MCCWLSLRMAWDCQSKTTPGKPLTFNELHLRKQLFSKNVPKNGLSAHIIICSVHKKSHMNLWLQRMTDYKKNKKDRHSALHVWARFCVPAYLNVLLEPRDIYCSIFRIKGECFWSLVAWILTYFLSIFPSLLQCHSL